MTVKVINSTDDNQPGDCVHSPTEQPEVAIALKADPRATSDGGCQRSWSGSGTDRR